MNCRPFAAILVALVGLVPATQSVSAVTPTHQRATATATATILTPATTAELRLRENRRTGEIGTRTKFGTTMIVRYLDDEGRLTSSTNPSRHKIIIIDLP